ncbi:MAG: tetratricopeptide repeat protein [Deltaproteobacteria bacterium]|nr:tetratricopeptide repeat protein [Deltaproteobacteria bacterium]
MSQSDFVSRGQALVAAGQFQEAVKVCRLGLLGRPTTVDGRVVLGQALLALKRFDEVLAEMRVALELDHSSIPAQVLKAEALLRKGDTAAAVETLHAARREAPGDPKIMQLLGEAEHVAMHKSAAHPAAAFIGAGDTKNYPNHPSGGGGDGMEDSGPESYTKPTSLQAPGSLRKSSKRQAVVPPPEFDREVPSAEELAVGDKSGTVEVDPEMEGVELDDDDDFDDVAAPPVAGAKPERTALGKKPGAAGGAKKQKKISTPTMDLDIGDVEMQETNLPRGSARPGPGTKVRNAVARPSGPIDMDDEPPSRSLPSQLAAMPPSPLPPAPRVPISAALPTMAAPLPPPSRAKPPSVQPSPAAHLPTSQAFPVPPVPAYAMPPQQPVMPQPLPQPTPAAMRPTMAIAPAPALPLSPSQQASAAAVDALFGHEQPAPQWNAASIAAANEPTARPDALDPALIALMNTEAPSQPQMMPPPDAGKPMKTGMRRNRSKLQLVLWIVVGVVVIGGGVFAGFQIRKMRLHKQIAEARDNATGLAKTDTYAGWVAARKKLDDIAGVSASIDNRAALARARAIMAYELGDGLPDAKAAVDQLQGKGDFDLVIAQAYLALAQNDPAAAKHMADVATGSRKDDPAAMYVAGEAQLLAGDAKGAQPPLKAAFEKDLRPFYGVALARAYAATSSWEDAIGTLDRVFAAAPEHPAAVIERGMILAAAGRIAPGSSLGTDVHTQLQKVITAKQVSPAQLAQAYLALAQVDYARGEVQAAKGDVGAAAQLGIDDQRFAEDAIDTLTLIGDLKAASDLSQTALSAWPSSRRVHIALAEILLAQGKAADALDILGKSDVASLPIGQAVRADAKLATGDVDGARSDYEAALKKQPNLERAVVGRAWLDIAENNLDEAKKRVESHYSDKGSSAALTTVYAAVLRRTGELDKAKSLLEKVVAGPASPDIARAQLELARLDRDTGDLRGARAAYGDASNSGSFDARFESALLLIDDRDPSGGRDTLDALVKEAGDKPRADLLLEAARARTLVGDHAGAKALLDQAEKLAGVPAWKLYRERGRIALHKGQFADAVAALTKALESSGDDAETFLLAADASGADEKGALADKIKKLVPDRLKNRPEAKIVEGKLLIAAGKLPDAEAAYKAAKEALKAEKATPRRMAQVDFGLAYIASQNGNTAEAQMDFELVMNEDPSIADAYLFAADLAKDKKQAYAIAQNAVKYNPDSPAGWLVVGKLAAQLHDKKTLADAIGRLKEIAPTGDELKELQKLR